MTTLHHPNLGELRGRLADGVAQYRGIKYGSLEHRFGTPVLYQGSRLSVTVDATEHGPVAYNPPDACFLEYNLIQQKLPPSNLPLMSDTECLNLTVTVPEPQQPRGKMPVFVFIHGGSLSLGSSSWPQYDLTAIVRRSIDLGIPVIGVGINYRTGVFGFITSQELRNAGFEGNNGLRDQKVAFQWIKENIAGFGGDPERITAIGHSAGGVSATLHLQSTEPLFHRMVVMAGTCLLLRPLQPTHHESLYEQFCESQGLAGLSGVKRINALEQISSQEIVMKTPRSIPYAPLLDGDFLKRAPTFESAEGWSMNGDSAIPGLQWCRELLVGDNQMDGNIFQLALRHRQEGIAKQFEESLKRSIPGQEPAINALLKAYGISTNPDDRTAYQSVLEFANDICFYIPEETFAENWPGTTYVYHLNEPNPWDGPFKGQCTHILDVVLLFKNFEHALDPSIKAVGQSFGDRIINFVNGEAPWQASCGSNRVAWVYGQQDGTGKLVKDQPELIGRRSAMFQFKNNIGWDNLHAAFHYFLAGK